MKHILYFAGYRMVVMRWESNAFTGIAEFEPDDKGFTAFENLLSREIKAPVKLLVDIIEEDFRLDKTPRLYGKDRAAIQKRIINKYFRQYPHTHLQVQTREKTGRRDDIVLISALTNAKLFQPWVDLLHKHKVALQGIYSLPLVGEALLKPLNAAHRDALVISQQIPGNLRQSFYAKGKLKLSRLAPGGDDSVSHYEVMRDETERTIRYLENQHYVDNNRKLNVYVIAPSSEHQQLNNILISDTRKQYHIIDKDHLAFELGIKSPTTNRYSNWLFAHLLLAEKYRKPHYGTHQDKRYFYHEQARRGIYATAAITLLVASVWSLSMLLDSYLLSNERKKMADETTKYNRLYDDIVKGISDLNLNVNNVRDAVDTAETLQEKYNTSPLEFMQTISRGLDQHPQIAIKKIRWLSTQDSGHSFGETKKPLDKRMLRAIQMGRKTLSYEKVLVEALVTDYNGNPRIAVERVNEFIDDLKAQQKADTIDVVKLPFDVDPASRMVGQGLDTSGRRKNTDAQFAFVMVKEQEI